MSIAVIASALLVAQAAPAVSGETMLLGPLPRQSLPTKGCAAFLWSTGTTRTLVAMVNADPAQLRLSIDGTVTDLPRASQTGTAGFGFADTTEFRVGTMTATLVMIVKTRADLKDGATVPEATLRLDREGKDSVVMPVVGIIGCS